MERREHRPRYPDTPTAEESLIRQPPQALMGCYEDLGEPGASKGPVKTQGWLTTVSGRRAAKVSEGLSHAAGGFFDKGGHRRLADFRSAGFRDLGSGLLEGQVARK